MATMPVLVAALEARTGLRRVLVAYGLYNLVEIASWLVVVLWAYDRGGAALAGLAAVVQLIPAAALAPLISTAGDRIPRGTALALAHALVAVATALTALAIQAGAPSAVVIAASTTVTTTVAVVRPIHYATLPQLADRARQLVSANSLSSLGEQVGFFVGPAIAGYGAAWSGPAAVMGALTLASAIGTVLCLGLPRSAPSLVDEEDTGFAAAVRGLRALRGDTGSLALLAAMTTASVLGGALDVLGVAYAEQTLDAGSQGAGLVVGAVGIGGLVGAGVSAWFAQRRALTGAIVGAAVIGGTAYAAVAFSGRLGVAVALLAVVGVTDAVLLVCARTLLQRTADESVLARVFAVQESMSLLGLSLGALLALSLIHI